MLTANQRNIFDLFTGKKKKMGTMQLYILLKKNK